MNNPPHLYHGRSANEIALAFVATVDFIVDLFVDDEVYFGDKKLSNQPGTHLYVGIFYLAIMISILERSLVALKIIYVFTFLSFILAVIFAMAVISDHRKFRYNPVVGTLKTVIFVLRMYFLYEVIKEYTYYQYQSNLLVANSQYQLSNPISLQISQPMQPHHIHTPASPHSHLTLQHQMVPPPPSSPSQMTVPPTSPIHMIPSPPRSPTSTPPYSTTYTPTLPPARSKSQSSLSQHPTKSLPKSSDF